MSVSFGGYKPGSAGRICQLQTEYYAKNWGFDNKFEGKVAEGMGVFIAFHDETRDFFLTAEVDGQVEGGITVCLEEDNTARIRWFIVSDNLRGTGAGRALFEKAMDYIHGSGATRAYLSTFKGLDAARALYEDAGFKLIDSSPGDTWGPVMTEQYFELILSSGDE